MPPTLTSASSASILSRALTYLFAFRPSATRQLSKSTELALAASLEEGSELLAASEVDLPSPSSNSQVKLNSPLTILKALLDILNSSQASLPLRTLTAALPSQAMEEPQATVVLQAMEVLLGMEVRLGTEELLGTEALQDMEVHLEEGMEDSREGTPHQV